MSKKLNRTVALEKIGENDEKIVYEEKIFYNDEKGIQYCEKKIVVREKDELH